MIPTIPRSYQINVPPQGASFVTCETASYLFYRYARGVAIRNLNILYNQAYQND